MFDNFINCTVYIHSHSGKTVSCVIQYNNNIIVNYHIKPIFSVADFHSEV